MKCPLCHNKSRITKTFYKVGATHRYRECLNKKCKHKFRTTERLSTDWNYKSIVSKIQKLVAEVD